MTLNTEAMEAAETRAEVGRFRDPGPTWRAVFLAMTAIGTFLSINQIFSLKLFLGIVILDNSYLYLLLGLFFAPVFLIFPATSRASRTSVPWYDVALFFAVVAITLYYAWNGLRSLNEGWEYDAPELPTYLGFAIWALILEGARRAGGFAIFLIFGLLSLYPIIAESSFLPDFFSGMEQDLVGTARYHALSEESVLGIPMRVFGTLIIGFIIFGVTLQSTGGGRFFINLAFALLGHVRGGPAKVAIIASGLFGSLSGSVITNVLTTGAMTIPTMKRTGYPARYAAGIEACASTGGVLMPPVMGATAFVMASFVDVPYIWVAIAAVVPSILYFYGLFVQIDAYAARYGLKGLPRIELPSVRETIRSGWYYIFAFVLLVYLLVYLKREAQAPFHATVALLALSQFGKLRLTDIWFWVLGAAILGFIGIVLASPYLPQDSANIILVAAAASVLAISHLPANIRIPRSSIVAFCESNGKLLSELVAILAAVGLIIGGVMVTGVAGTFAGDLVRLAGGNVYLLLLLGAFTSFLLGIGMTVTAAYIFLAIVLAPALVELGLDKMAVHLFILYWGMVSFITPPVALGAFAAATVAGSTPMRTGLEAMRLGSIIYFLPFFFVLNPALVLNGPIEQILIEVPTALAGVTLVASGLQGYLVFVGAFGTSVPSLIVRFGMIASGLCLAFPELTSNLIGLAILVPTVIAGRFIALPKQVAAAVAEMD